MELEYDMITKGGAVLECGVCGTLAPQYLIEEPRLQRIEPVCESCLTWLEKAIHRFIQDVGMGTPCN